MAVLLFLGTPDSSLADEVPRFEPTECWSKIFSPRRVDCGYLVVPELRTRPDGPTIRLAIAIFRTQSADRLANPLIMITGGPGGAIGFDGYGVVDWHNAIRQIPALERREVILLDQRGAGLSQPNLDCGEFADHLQEIMRAATDATKYFQVQTDLMRDCRDRLIRDGHGLAGYTTSAIAADIADLRRVLEFESWNLYGVSYGTQIALTVMRDHPEGLRSVILDSAIPLQTPWYGTYWSLVWSAMERMFDACAANPRCHELHPDLRADYSNLVAELNSNPIVVTRPHPLSGEPVTIPISGSLLGETMIMVLGFNRWDVAVFTMARLQRRDQAAAEFIGDVAMWFMFQAVSEGQYFAVVCQDENPLADPEGVSADLGSYTKLAGATVPASYEQICRDWIFEVSPATEREPVKSAIPTLILSGEFDPMTPPILAKTVHADLENSYLFEFPDQGHGLAFLTRCAPQLISEFLDDPGRRPDKVCLKWRTEPVFFSAP